MRVVVVASGALAPSDPAWLEAADFVIAADGGAASLDLLGRRPDLVIGDLDSADPTLVERLAASGVRIVRHPADKDASDTELALEAGVEAGATTLVVLGAMGGERIDHALANLLLLADPALAGRDVCAVHGATRVRAIHSGAPMPLGGAIGELVTLLPVGGDARGVTTRGLRWPLEDATLQMGRSRGLSNEITVVPASVRVGDGTLLAIEIATQGGLT